MRSPRQEPAAQEPVSKVPAAEEPVASDQASGALTDDEGAQASLPIGEAPSPQALLNQWYRRYPDAFFKGHTRPLRVGIHEDLLVREPWPEKLVRRALACYVHLPRYLKAVREHAERVGLDGEVEGPVTEGEARYARKKLEELRAQQQVERSGKASPPDSKKGANKQGGRKNRTLAGRQTGQQEGAGLGSARADDATSSHQSVAEQKAQSAPSAVSSSSSEAPAERLERKLGALLAKHSPR
ncbi:MAG: ProQ/FINO family protein [Onishia taeanensis]